MSKLKISDVWSIIWILIILVVVFSLFQKCSSSNLIKYEYQNKPDIKKYEEMLIKNRVPPDEFIFYLKGEQDTYKMWELYYKGMEQIK